MEEKIKKLELDYNKEKNNYDELLLKNRELHSVENIKRKSLNELENKLGDYNSNSLQKEIDFLEDVDNITTAGRMILTNGNEMMYADWTGEEYNTEASLPTYDQMQKEFFEMEAKLREEENMHHGDGCGCGHDHHHEDNDGCGCGCGHQH